MHAECFQMALMHIHVLSYHTFYTVNSSTLNTESDSLMSVNYSNISPPLTAAGIHEDFGIGTVSFALQMDQPLAANVLF